MRSAGRVDAFLAAHTGLGRRRLAAAFDAGLVRVNGRRARKGDLVAPGDAVDLDDGVLAAAGPPVPEPDRPLEVVHVDARLVVVAKAAGVPCHPLRGERGTLAGALVARYPECARASDDPREGGLVHRLDVGTSGVLVAARDAAAWRSLRAAFGAGETRKTYLALVDGDLAAPRVITAAIAQDVADPRRVRVGPEAGDDPRRRALAAETRVEPVRRLEGRTLVRATMSTGRMHQVRAHLASIGHPLAGDTLYGGSAGEGFLLHAESIELPHPDGGRTRYEVAAPVTGPSPR